MIQRARGRPKIGILLQAGQPGELLRLNGCSSNFAVGGARKGDHLCPLLGAIIRAIDTDGLNLAKYPSAGSRLARHVSDRS